MVDSLKARELFSRAVSNRLIGGVVTGVATWRDD